MQNQSPTLRSITDDVRNMYEKFPYPHYPLLATLKWPDGYLATSLFSSALLSSSNHTKSATIKRREESLHSQYLIAGCGEVLPYIVRKNETVACQLTCIDLSITNLKRARFRNIFTLGHVDYLPCDLHDYLQATKQQRHQFDHIDCYGVLHHTVSPDKILAGLSDSLKPSGTMRIMVYNRDSRRWIYHFSHALYLLKLSPYHATDRKTATSLIHNLSRYIPALREKFSQVNPCIMRSTEQFVDAFFHEHEAQISIEKWLRFIDESGLKIMGVLDRHAELDDLKNPLWTPPSLAELNARSSDARYEQNLEIFLYKPDKSAQYIQHRDRQNKLRSFKAIQLKTKSPPSGWFRYEETKNLPFFTKIHLWQSFVDHVYQSGSGAISQKDLDKIPPEALKRLARIGAIFKDQIGSNRLIELANNPLHESMDLPIIPDFINIKSTPLVDQIKAILLEKESLSDRRFKLILERLNKAQHPEP